MTTRRAIADPCFTTFPMRGLQLVCPFGCGSTLVYTMLGTQCSDGGCPSMGGPVSKVPERSPYQHGDRVQLHGYPGEGAGHRRTGFRGIVTGSLGATILRGITDDGAEWAEYWGVLDPDGAKPSNVIGCSCCPRPPRKPLQLELFGMAS